MKKVIFFWCLLLNSIYASAQIPTIGLIGYSPFSTNDIRGNNARAYKASLATIQSFDSHKERTLIRTNAIEKFDMQNRSAAKVDVAKTIKISYWSNANNVWDLMYATDATYANDKLVSELILSYSLTDTFAKEIYNYDANGKMSSNEYQEYDQIYHRFIPFDKTSYSYNNNGSYVELYEIYLKQSNTWKPQDRRTYNFNSNKAQIKYLEEVYGNGLWSISSGDSNNITYYNNTSKILQDKSIGYNLNTNIWEAQSEIINSYNNIGQIISEESYLYFNNVAYLDLVDSVKYEASGVPKSIIYYAGATMEVIREYDNLIWKSIFNPNVNLFDNELIGYVEKAYQNNILMYQNRFSTIYPDNFGSKIKLYEDYVNNAYRPSYKESILNDFNFNLIENTSQYYNSTWGQEVGYKYAYRYDANNRIIECIYLSSSGLGNGTFINTDRAEYSNFIKVIAGVSPNQNTLEVKLYPNPSENGNVKINLNLEKSSNISISVIDINGRKVSSQEVNLGTGLNTVQLSNMNTGLYFIEIISDYGISKTKLIVK